MIIKEVYSRLEAMWLEALETDSFVSLTTEIADLLDDMQDDDPTLGEEES